VRVGDRLGAVDRHVAADIPVEDRRAQVADARPPVARHAPRDAEGVVFVPRREVDDLDGPGRLDVASARRCPSASKAATRSFAPSPPSLSGGVWVMA